MTDRPKLMTSYNPQALCTDRQYDWEAWWSDQAGNDHVGYGRTEPEAILDLQRLDQERWEAEHPDEEDPPWLDTQ